MTYLKLEKIQKAAAVTGCLHLRSEANRLTLCRDETGSRDVHGDACAEEQILEGELLKDSRLNECFE